MKEQLTKQNAELKKEVDKHKNDLKKAKEDITSLKNKMQTLEEKVEMVDKKNNDTTTVTDNNLKYLINIDRERRSQNIMIFGVKEEGVLKIGSKALKEDKEKVSGILDFLGENDSVMNSYVRLGKEKGKRPIKVFLNSKSSVFRILKNASKLKTLNDKIFIKPDKTRKEREEFQRLGKRKEELMKSHITPEGGQQRVILSNGILKLDGLEVDSYKSPQSLF